MTWTPAGWGGITTVIVYGETIEPQVISYRDGIDWRMVAWTVDALYGDLA